MLTEPDIKAELAALRDRVRALEVKVEALEMARPVVRHVLQPDKGGAMRPE